MKEKIFRAGIIPYYITDNRVELLFMRPSDSRFGGNEFQIAKGKQESDENALDAALREGYEELGLLKENCGDFIDIGYHLGRTHFWAVKILDKNNFIKPHFETEETCWLSESELDVIRNIHKPVIQYTLKLIKQQMYNDDPN